MKYTFYKGYHRSLRALYQKGGRYTKAADRALEIQSRIVNGKEPFAGIPTTNHGENRIKHCVKYDLNGFCRLITIQHKGLCALCFIGTHDDCDAWLKAHKGFRLSQNNQKQLENVFESMDLDSADTRLSRESDFSNGLLYTKLSERYIDRLAERVSRSTMRKFEAFDSLTTEVEILEAATEIEDPDACEAMYDTFILLKGGDVDGAKRRVDLYTNESLRLEVLSTQEIENIVEGDNFITFEQFDPEFIDHYMKTASFQDWMLFMHPEQRKIVDRDFKGPARLVGVSGSGKTCVVIKRAVRLAQKYAGEKILILTLNRSLAQLIDNLMDSACPESVRDSIVCTSFWELCREELGGMDIPNFAKRFDDVTWKLNEHISEIWSEFYHCEANNEDARVLLPVHTSLTAQHVLAQDYLYQEFDYVRSALSSKERDQYVRMEREGRCIPFAEPFREHILDGLASWEDKMEFVGITDYLGLASALYEHKERLEPKYRCVLVDEAQDFGVLELKIIRRLVTEGANDIFLAGDEAQQVYTKYHNFKAAGIEVLGRRVSSIKKNYRNSREILSAAFNILSSNLPDDPEAYHGVKILNPEYANFSTPRPLLLRAESLDLELGYAVNFLRNNLNEDQKGCIAICGLGLKDVKAAGAALDLPVLDGLHRIEEGRIFLSDLEQSKGFEFDVMIILNCSEGVIPNSTLPKDEWHRELFKLYVAMTRAKRTLILSHSGQPSLFLEASGEFFQEQLWELQENSAEIPGFALPHGEPNAAETDSILDCTGQEFVYRPEALGMPREVQDKLLSIVTGRTASENGKQKEWRTIRDVLEIRDVPTKANLFGKQTLQAFEAFFEKFQG